MAESQRPRGSRQMCMQACPLGSLLAGIKKLIIFVTKSVGCASKGQIFNLTRELTSKEVAGVKIDFEDLYQRFFRDVYLFVLSMSKDPHIAEEITQETFFKALKEIKHFRGNCSVKSWLCQIAKNLYISYTRKKKAVHSDVLEEMPDSSNVEDICIQKGEALSVYKLLHCLEDPYKEVFTLRVLGDLSFKEIAEIFGKQESWARVTYHRARLKIQALISD
jgi:RNA polymerase sigma factor (sigma-70 family)